MKASRAIALLGQPDHPTDAVEEYCRYLSEALQPRHISLELDRVSWAKDGWDAALKVLREKSTSWRGDWVLLQYTALAWSARGFPLRFLHVIEVLRKAATRIGVVFHDVEPYGGARIVDRFRRRIQLRAMRQTLRASDLAIFTVSPSAISWLPKRPSNATFIPVGANFPDNAIQLGAESAGAVRPPRVAVFGITGGETGRAECSHIIEALRFASAKLGSLELYAFGRHATDFESILQEGFRNTQVGLFVDGVLPAEEVAQNLCACDALLFVRGAISTRRGSAIAGIACGLPVIASADSETAAPITEAGLVLFTRGDQNALNEGLLRVLSDPDYRSSLADRSRRTYDKYFSWKAIAANYEEKLFSSQAL
jgi:glycosyltransferase involved in cell wall biosynthesis